MLTNQIRSSTSATPAISRKAEPVKKDRSISLLESSWLKPKVNHPHLEQNLSNLSANLMLCPQWDLNPHWNDFKSSASADWAMGASGYALGLDAQASKAARGVLVAAIETMSRLRKRLAIQPSMTLILRSHVGMAKPW